MKQHAKNLALASVLGVPFMIAGGSAAQAAPLGNPVSVQVGAGFLTSCDAKDNSSSTGLHLGASIGLQNTSLLSAKLGTPSIDLDYNHAAGHGNHVDAFGVSYDERVNLIPVSVPTPKGGAVPYVGLGIGVFDNSVSKNVSTSKSVQVNTGSQITTSTTTTSSSQSKSALQFGGKLIAGLSVGQEFVEASYVISGSVNGVNTNAINVALGVHF